MKPFILSLLTFFSYYAHAQNSAPQAVSIPDTVVMLTLPTDFILSANGSSDPDGDELTYHWVVAGDTVANEATHTLQLAVNETDIRLIVTDPAGLKDTEDFTVFVGHPTNHGLNRITFRGNQSLFASGMNIAWHRFANDLTVFDAEAERYYRELMDSIASNGGNSLRWWLHTNGAKNPQVDTSGFVTGIEEATIQNMKLVLDLAYEYNLMISMCLWSFDMLQNNQQQDPERMKKLLEREENVQSYVDNALIPILRRLGDHPAVMTWEIFNEPEGMTSNFGWSSAGRVSMEVIQRFVNKCTGAIHREVPGAQVSNGSWSFKASSDVGPGFKNYYSDERLIAAGGDPDGTLDFYQVHYYPHHFGNDHSPFHRPADYWGLDKPIVIGEFPADTIAGKAKPRYSIEEAYELAVAYGYAGILSWSWSSTSDFNKDFSAHTAAGLRAAASMIPEALRIDNSGAPLNKTPWVVQQAAPFRSYLENLPTEVSYLDVNSLFADDQSEPLRFQVSAGDNWVTPTIQDGQLQLTFTNPPAATAQLQLKAYDTADWYAETGAVVMLASEKEAGNNLAHFKSITASSQSAGAFAEYANDGDPQTRWQSDYGTEQSLQVDLGATTIFNFLSIDWGPKYAKTYEVQVSSDGEQWSTLESVASSVGRPKVLAFDETKTARYVRLLMTDGNHNGNYQVDEISVEYWESNEAPTVLTAIEDYSVKVGQTKTINNYVRYNEVFADKEHPDLLTYGITNSNESLVSVVPSLGNVGIRFLFSEGAVGDATITLAAQDPFGATAEVSFQVSVTEQVLMAYQPKAQLLAPNPTGNWLTILEPGFEWMEVYDLQGNQLLRTKVLIGNMQLPDWPEGVYVVRLYGEQVSETKLIINHE
ncbi:discoidin domain-containing protein [Marinoscillum furvescens]|uniref:Putative secreted protein (Por secretion system target) n=1 Tax=Marinoscillum furvescens DSM 4134 TaxID=1122208 RepID=A0A3D9KZ10_MARFU|nr:discoidin domain-containing protein [Marinoscillum furvescens]RED95282.1 putative secreted protein (Por secretion system target) [Marinoscillum furvescens DSM 4134]